MTLINLSLQEGVFAESWKMAIICPLIKKLGLELVYSNYRPVSNLPFLSKVVEKCMLKQFNIHCDNNLLPDYQSAYRQNYSTKTSIIKLCNDVLWAMENQQLTAFTAIDLPAAFDTVDHDILLNVLTTKFNVTGTALKLLDSYLRPRFCKVAVNGCFSSNKELKFSVPQGSCAGPVLYTAYSSTMAKVVPKMSLYLGMQMTMVLRHHADPFSRKRRKQLKVLEKCAVELKAWMDKNRL